MNPFEYIDAAGATIAHHSVLALGVALIGGVLSTST